MNRGFTLVEVLVASAAATIIIVLLYSSLVFYSRAYTREDEALERGRRGQEVLGLFRDDAERSQGEVQPGLIPVEALRAVGYTSDAAILLGHARQATNIINMYTNLQAQKPYMSKKYGFKEVWARLPGPGEPALARNKTACTYVGTPPPPKVRDTIPPFTSEACILHIPVPYDTPKSDYVVMRKVIGGEPSPVVWAFHREATGKWPRFSLLRWTPQTGVQSVGGEQIEVLHLAVMYDWSYADPAPPRRPAPHAQLLKMQAELHLTFGRSRVQGSEPGFEMGAIFLVGP